MAYYPWIKATDSDGSGVTVPATGHVAGVWARVDAARGIHKAPTNESLRGVVGLAQDISGEEQTDLAGQGVNVLRKFPGTGFVVWGARTLAAGDPSVQEDGYLNVRRTVNFIRQSISQSTAWAASEPDGDTLRSSVTASVTNFLTSLWQQGALVGKSAEEAFYVVCENQGQLTVDVGVAIVRPSEFVTFRVTQGAGKS
ncbi:phage tail sheath subtilisin-like domain-containing protein [Streptomyces hyaluromycini]|uniref:Phage tail sheath subtilisin-like domain-containing protein n=1 Tax=Streptomyces hyaluromycini TaxID=1377993 RepID=A0ABV1WNZ7_9ACTN